MFTGLSAFPITPFHNEQLDMLALEKIIDNLVAASVDSICAMGSTGLYPYLSEREKFTITAKVVEHAQGIPVLAGIGSLRTRDILKNLDTVQNAGASAVLLAPVSYHPLKEEEVLCLYQQVCAELSVPLVVYENPGVTNFTFSDELYHEVTRLPCVAAIKIPGTPFASKQGIKRLDSLRSIVPSHVAIGVSGDKYGAAGMAAGCDLWLSVLGGLFPRTVLKLIATAKSDISEQDTVQASHLEGIWELFARNNGGLRVMATAADILGYTEQHCLPAPLKPLAGEDRETLQRLLADLPMD